MEHTLKCSDCNTPLMHYEITNTKGPITNIRAICPFCNGTSFITTIHGKFVFGPIGQDEVYKTTVIENISQENEIWNFIVRQRK